MTVLSLLSDKGFNTFTIRPTETVRCAIDRFRDRGIGALIVSSDFAHIDGIITERHIIHGLATYGGSLLGMAVADVMRNGPVCHPDDQVESAMARMIERRIRYLPVATDGVLCGIVSVGDVMKRQLQHFRLESKVLRDGYWAVSVTD